MVVVLQIPGRRTARHHEAESGLRVGIGQTGNQSGQRQEIPERREDGVVDLASTGHLSGRRRYPAEAGPAWRRRDEPWRVADSGTDPGPEAWAHWPRAVRVAPPVAGAID